MGLRVINNVMESADQRRDHAAEAERFGRPRDDTARSLKSARITAVPEETEGVAHIGSAVPGGAALQRVRVPPDRGGIVVEAPLVEEAEACRVGEVILFIVPIGTAVEVFFGPSLDYSPVLTPFVTRVEGHVAFAVIDRCGAFGFCTEVQGLPPRNTMRRPTPPEFASLLVRFFGVHERCHSVVLCRAVRGGVPGVVHIIFEVDSLDSVTYALDHVVRNGLSPSSRGRHSNNVLSFYAQASGRWGIELGADSIKVDEMHYMPEEIIADGYWREKWSEKQLLAAV